MTKLTGRGISFHMIGGRRGKLQAKRPLQITPIPEVGNPRQKGTNPRAKGTNPRATGTNPRSTGTNKGSSSTKVLTPTPEE